MYFNCRVSDKIDFYVFSFDIKVNIIDFWYCFITFVNKYCKKSSILDGFLTLIFRLDPTKFEKPDPDPNSWIFQNWQQTTYIGWKLVKKERSLYILFSRSVLLFTGCSQASYKKVLWLRQIEVSAKCRDSKKKG